MRARDLMSTPVITVTPKTSVKQAATLLSSHGFTALPVVDDEDRLVGIVTEADIIQDRFPRDPRYRHAYTNYVDGTADDSIPTAAATVGAVMTAAVIAMSPDTDVVDVVTAMLGSSVRSMPIVDGSRLVGIVTRRDLVRALARNDQAIAADVRRRLRMYGGPDRWSVEVHEGQVIINDEFDDATDRHVATVLAEAVPGVTGVHTVAPDNLVRWPSGLSVD
jgi:CBS domain-containing protein